MLSIYKQLICIMPMIKNNNDQIQFSFTIVVFAFQPTISPHF